MVTSLPPKHFLEPRDSKWSMDLLKTKLPAFPDLVLLHDSLVRVGMYGKYCRKYVSASGNYFSAAYLKPKEKAIMEADVVLGEDRVIRFMRYEATVGIQFKGCCDSVENCPFSTDGDVSIADKSWHSSSFVCPRGTQKVSRSNIDSDPNDTNAALISGSIRLRK